MDPTYKGLPTPVPAKIARRGLNWKLVLIIAGGFLLVITVLGVIFTRGGNSDSLLRLGYRLDNLSALASSTSSNIKDAELKKTNAELLLVLDGDRAALKDILPTAQDEKNPASPKSIEAGRLSNHKEDLKSALASGNHDTTYDKLLRDELQSLFGLAETALKESSNSRVRQPLVKLQEHLTFYFNLLEQR